MSHCPAELSFRGMKGPRQKNKQTKSTLTVPAKGVLRWNFPLKALKNDFLSQFRPMNDGVLHKFYTLHPS